MIGQTISHYKILDKIGEGGMGVVYTAEDTKLHRTVALKFIRPDAVENREVKARFLNEAEAAAALSHPGVCVVYEIDEADSKPFIAMEYVEGETLAAKIRRRPLPLDEALDISAQVAEGLQAAHEKGIVHRDIKPANIMVGAKGRTKIMDFGLAHLEEATKITKTGTSLGTPAYMSPEQVRGEEVDHRADIWSLGVVLYEMLAGRLPFRGEVKEAVSHSILYDEPEPLTALRSGLPIDLERIVKKALSKNKEERYPHVDDMLVDLRTLRRSAESSSGEEQGHRERVGPAATGRPFGFRKVASLVVAGLVVAAALYLWGPWRSTAPEAQPPVRFAAALPEGEAIDLPVGESLDRVGGVGSPLALSRDGTKLVYVARRDKAIQLYLRRLGGYESVAIPGTEGARAPFFSPDGNWIGFAVGGRVKKVSLLGEQPQTLCTVNVCFFGGSWGPDDIAFFGDCSTGLKRVSVLGGGPELISSVSTTPGGPGGKVESQHQYPQLLPGGKAILFTIWNGLADSAIAVLDLETGDRRRVVEPGSYGRYVPTGHLVYAWDGNLLAAPFDPEKLRVTGPSVPVVRGVAMETTRGAAYFTMSQNGTLAYVPGGVMETESTLAWVDREGNEELLPFPAGRLTNRVSPDGKHVIVSRLNESSGMSELWIYELERGVQRRFTGSEGAAWWAVWTPDGKRVVYNSLRAGDTLFLYWKPVDLSGPEEQLTKNEFWQQPYSWSADGRLLAFQESNRYEMGFNIWVLPMEGDRKPQPFLRSRFNETHPAMSPDGQWLAYASDESGHWEVMLRPYPGPGGVTQVSTEGGMEPLWSRDGRDLYYRSGSKLMRVSFQVNGNSPLVGRPQLILEGNYAGGIAFGRKYDLHPDGKRFLMVKMAKPPPAPTQYRIVVNWFDELKRLVPSS